MRIHYKPDGEFGLAFTAEEWATMMRTVGCETRHVDKAAQLSEFIESIAAAATAEKETDA